MLRLAFITAVLLQPSVGIRLEETVNAFGKALAMGDRVSAVQLVHSQDRDIFLARQSVPARNWEVRRIEMKSPAEAVVEVAALRQVAGREYAWTRTQIWMLEDGEWRLRISDRSAPLRALFESDANPGVTTSELRVYPSTLKFHLLSRTQEVSLWIHNGLESEVKFELADVDNSSFEVLPFESRVAPGSKVRLRVRYVGSDAEKELKTHFRVGIDGANEHQEFVVPVLYNHVSQGARALLGLTTTDVAALRRGAALTLTRTGDTVGSASSKGHAEKPKKQ